eukprot:scaffold22086_cov28-Tisochrysis_lutea.AAC.1
MTKGENVRLVNRAACLPAPRGHETAVLVEYGGCAGWGSQVRIVSEHRLATSSARHHLEGRG